MRTLLSQQNALGGNDLFLVAGPAFLAGILVFLALPGLPGLGWVVGAGLAFGLSLSFRCWPAAWLTLGFCWVSAFVMMNWHPLNPDLHGIEVEVEGQVEDFPVSKRGGWRFNLKANEPQGSPLPARIRLSWYGGARIETGQQWHLTVKLRPPRGFRNPGGFDFERWLFARQIGAVGYVVKRGRNQLLSGASGLDAVRQRLADAIDTSLGKSPMAGIVKALTLGERSGISATQWQVLRATGTAHLIAISGLHIGLVAGGVLFFCRRIGLRCGIERGIVDPMAASTSLLAALGYAALAGFSLPTQRALIMLVTGVAAWLWQRQASPWRSFSLAMLAVLLWDPLAPLGAGFWLSFLAVAWILHVASGRLRPPSSWLAMVQIQMALLLGMAPLLGFFFGQVGLTAPLANVVAVPVVGLIVVPVALVSCALWWWLPQASDLLWHLADRLLAILWQGLSWLAAWGDGVWHHSSQSLFTLGLALAGVALVLMPRGMPGRWLGTLMAVAWVFPAISRPPPGSLWLTVLDVGQGLAVVAETENHVLVYDTGPRYSDRFDAGADIINPFLKSRGWRHLDRIIISHADGDHSGGLPGLQRFWDGGVWSSVPLATAGGVARLCVAGQHWLWDQVGFDMLWPAGDDWGSENDRSCVLKIRTQAGAVLLPGDIERGAEDRLVTRYGTELRAQVLVAPHHGSATSSSGRFVRMISPETVLISSGYHNRFGFPSPISLKRYQAVGARVFNTANAGAIEIRMDAEGRTQVRQQRLLQRHVWNFPKQVKQPTALSMDGG